MRVRLGAKTRRLGPEVRSPVCGVTKEETLVARETVDVWRSGLTGERLLICGVGDHESAEIGDAFAFLELPVAVQAWFNFKSTQTVSRCSRRAP